MGALLLEEKSLLKEDSVHLLLETKHCEHYDGANIPLLQGSKAGMPSGAAEELDELAQSQDQGAGGGGHGSAQRQRKGAPCAAAAQQCAKSCR